MSGRFNTHQNHPLIEREQTYFLEKSYITIHSEDRDISKWHDNNNFEVTLPRDMTNVICMRLSDITVPSCIYTFSNNKQNTKFRFKVVPQINSTDPNSVLEYNALLNALNNICYYEVTISEGYYHPINLALEIQNKMNNTVTKTLESLVDGSLNPLPNCYIYNKFVVKYNPVNHKMEIMNCRDYYVLLFEDRINYDVDCGVKDVWEQYINWGFPYYIGFGKQNYVSTENQGYYTIDSIGFMLCSSNDKIADIVYYTKTETTLDLDSDNTFYIELERYNNMDEIDPYSCSTNNVYSNDYSGRTNGAFAKITLENNPFKNTILSKCDFLNYITTFKIPIQKIRKLKFKFRHHDGRLVDFKNQNFNFTVEISQLIDEQLRYKIINNMCHD